MQRSKNIERVIIFITLVLCASNALCDDRTNKQIQARALKLAALQKAQPARFRFVGEIARGYSTAYSINGEDFNVAPDAEIQGSLRCGATAEVSGPIGTNAEKIADYVLVAEGLPGSNTVVIGAR